MRQLNRVIEQRLSLTVRRLRRSNNLAEEGIAVRVLHTGDIERLHEKDSKDDKGKDPLQRDNLDRDLLDSEACNNGLVLGTQLREQRELTQHQETQTVAQKVIFSDGNVC